MAFVLFRRLVVAGAAAALIPATAPARADAAPGADTGLRSGRISVPATASPLVARNFTVVGQSDLGGTGFNADVWAHAGFAYVGVWSGPTCPATGVKVADIRRPTRPRVVSVLANPAGTSAEDVVVRSVRTAAFNGDLAIAGIQACRRESDVFRGLQLFDVTNPYRPRALGQWRAPGRVGGCHEIDLVQTRDGRVLAGCAVPFAEGINATDEVNLVDVSNPRRPRKVAGWALQRDLGIDPTGPQNVGAAPASFAHSVRFADRGRTLYASYWDYGTIRFDLYGRNRIGYVSHADIAPPDEDGDNHSMTLAQGGRVMVINPEDFSPVETRRPDRFNGWGEAYIYTNSRTRPRFLSRFSTPNSRSSRTDGFYSVHNTEVVRGDQAFSSWYSDGIVWWTLADPRAPRLRGQFVPPARPDPQGVFPRIPLVWGVYLDSAQDLVLASDINSGLWLLRARGLGGF